MSAPGKWCGGFLALWAAFYLGWAVGSDEPTLLIVPVVSLAVLCLILFHERRAA